MTKEHVIESSATKTAMTNDMGSTSFPCPNCGKTTIHRTRKEREIVIPYTCSECGFTGPN